MPAKLTTLLPSLALLALASREARAQTPFRDVKQPLNARVNDFIKQLSLEEKAQQMLDQSPAVARLVILAYGWWNEALHGGDRSAPATVFPQAIGLGATFDGPNATPYDKLGPEVVNSAAHRALAKEVALKAMVLLKNNGALPLRPDLGKYLVAGPNVTSVEALLGNYYGVNGQLTTILAGLVGAVQPGSQIEDKQGALLDRPNINPIDWTTGKAKQTDAILIVLGITGVLEGKEGESIASPNAGDQLDYNLTQNQTNFLRKLRQGSETPIVAIVTGGSPMNLSGVQELADTVLLTWYPGEEGGNAVADLVFGKASPSGCLPVTFPQSLAQLPAYESYGMKGRTYRYLEAEPMYPFGYGLSYGKLTHSGARLSATKTTKTKAVELTATVTNTGQMASEKVVQLYLTHPPKAGVQTPLFALEGYQRVKLAPGVSRAVKFTLAPDRLALVGKDGTAALPSGPLTAWVGGALPSASSLALGAAKPASVVLTIN